MIHSSAIIDEGAIIGEGARIWHWVHVCSEATIGAGCVLGQNVYVGPRVVIGAGSRIQNNVSVFENVTLEEDVFCGPSVVFTNVRNPRAHVARKEEFSPTLVRRGATLGANATILCGVEIGEYAFVGAGSVVVKDVAPYALVVGNPAHQIGWSCACGERLGEQRHTSCGRCGARYELKIDRLVPCS